MTFMEALANPEIRRIIDAIEDMKASLDGRGEDDLLWDVLHHACRDLEEKTGLILD